MNNSNKLRTLANIVYKQQTEYSFAEFLDFLSELPDMQEDALQLKSDAEILNLIIDYEVVFKKMSCTKPMLTENLADIQPRRTIKLPPPPVADNPPQQSFGSKLKTYSKHSLACSVVYVGWVISATIANLIFYLANLIAALFQGTPSFLKIAFIFFFAGEILIGLILPILLGAGCTYALSEKIVSSDTGLRYKCFGCFLVLSSSVLLFQYFNGAHFNLSLVQGFLFAIVLFLKSKQRAD